MENFNKVPSSENLRDNSSTKPFFLEADHDNELKSDLNTDYVSNSSNEKIFDLNVQSQNAMIDSVKSENSVVSVKQDIPFSSNINVSFIASSNEITPSNDMKPLNEIGLSDENVCVNLPNSFQDNIVNIKLDTSDQSDIVNPLAIICKSSTCDDEVVIDDSNSIPTINENSVNMIPELKNLMNHTIDMGLPTVSNSQTHLNQSYHVYDNNSPHKIEYRKYSHDFQGDTCIESLYENNNTTKTINNNSNNNNLSALSVDNDVNPGYPVLNHALEGRFYVDDNTPNPTKSLQESPPLYCQQHIVDNMFELCHNLRGNKKRRITTDVLCPIQSNRPGSNQKLSRILASSKAPSFFALSGTHPTISSSGYISKSCGNEIVNSTPPSNESLDGNIVMEHSGNMISAVDILMNLNMECKFNQSFNHSFDLNSSSTDMSYNVMNTNCYLQNLAAAMKNQSSPNNNRGLQVYPNTTVQNVQNDLSPEALKDKIDAGESDINMQELSSAPNQLFSSVKCDAAKMYLVRMAELFAKEKELFNHQQNAFRILKNLNLCFPDWGNHLGSFLWHTSLIFSSASLHCITQYTLIFEDLINDIAIRLREAITKSIEIKQQSTMRMPFNTNVKSRLPRNLTDSIDSASSVSNIHSPTVDPLAIMNEGASNRISNLENPIILSDIKIPLEVVPSLFTSLIFQVNSSVMMQTIILLDNLRQRHDNSFQPLSNFQDIVASFVAIQALHGVHQPPIDFILGTCSRFKSTADISVCSNIGRGGKRRSAIMAMISGQSSTNHSSNFIPTSVNNGSKPRSKKPIVNSVTTNSSSSLKSIPPTVDSDGRRNDRDMHMPLDPNMCSANDIDSWKNIDNQLPSIQESGLNIYLSKSKLDVSMSHNNPDLIMNDKDEDFHDYNENQEIGIDSSKLSSNISRRTLRQPSTIQHQDKSSSYLPKKPLLGRINGFSQLNSTDDNPNQENNTFNIDPTSLLTQPLLGEQVPQINTIIGTGTPTSSSIRSSSEICSPKAKSNSLPGNRHAQSHLNQMHHLTSNNINATNSSLSQLSNAIEINDGFELPRDPEAFRSQVKGVYYDDTSNRWCASWHERKTGKKKSRYFAVKKFGFSTAKTHAMDARLEAEESGECAPTNIN